MVAVTRGRPAPRRRSNEHTGVEEAAVDLDPRGAHAPSPAAGTVPAELVEHAPEGLAVIDADARFVEANPAAVALCGLLPGQVTGTRSPFPAPGSDPAAARTGESTVEWQP